MANTIPWATNPEDSLTPEELEEWLTYRDTVALQLRIDHLGEDYHNYRNPNTNLPKFKEFVVGSEEEMVKLLEDILEGRL